MSEQLAVDPAELRNVAAQASTQADERLLEQTAAHNRMVEALPRLVGTSAAALSTLTTHWESGTAQQFGEILSYSERFAAAALLYEGTDTTAATAITQAARDISARMGL